MKWNAGDHNVRLEQERAFDEQRVLIVQEVLPDPPRHKLRQDHRHIPVRIFALDLLDVFEAVNSTNIGSAVVPDGNECSVVGSGSSVPLKYRQAPTAIIVKMLTMKKYVGPANMRPDSRMPRRFPIINSTTKPRHTITGSRRQWGSADVIAATPAAILTDTVKT